MISFEQGKAIFVENSLEYSREIHEKFEIYCNFMVEYNKKCESYCDYRAGGNMA